MKASIVNRVGDFGLSSGISATSFASGAVDYSTVFATASDLASALAGSTSEPFGLIVVAG